MAKKLKAGLLLSCFIVLLSSTSCEGVRNIDPVLQLAIDSFVQDLYLPLSQINGIGLAIVQNDGELLYTTGYGMADEEKGIRNSNTTQFLIASVTKSVTSTVVVKVLHEKFPELGESVLDTPIRKLIPQANFTLIDRFRSEQVSFRDLLAHRLCLFRDDLQSAVEAFNSSSEIIYRQRYNTEICSIRSEFQYNNQMYMAAGELIEILAEKSYKNLVEDLLSEIGMVESTFITPDDDFSQMPYRGQPYYVMDNISYPINPELIKRAAYTIAAGGLFLTPNDMAKYARFRLNLGKVDGRQVVPEECIRWMNKPSIWQNINGYKSSSDDLVRNYHSYGLGLSLGSFDGWEHISHGGYWPPYSSMMSLFPGKNLSIFTSTNMGPPLIDAQILHEAMFLLITGRDNVTETFLAKAKEFRKLQKENKMKKEESLKKLIEEHKGKRASENIFGKYGSGSAGDLEILERFNETTNSTSPYISYGRWGKGWLEQLSGDLYKIHFDTDMVQDFYAGGSKDASAYIGIANETVDFLLPYPDGLQSLGKFKLGVSLDRLPPIPWNPGSCGPE